MQHIVAKVSVLGNPHEYFALRESGQKALVYFAPHPPVRQQELNKNISDTFYRELFMSPCLSGWDRGEEKHRYMQLCHQVLSRSQLNAVAKLREAGIIVNNLVVLPNLSNVSLANNGTHISIGSRKLGKLLGDPASGFTAAHEKRLGDLVIKMTEHFLPLFVGTYSAAPYRLAFTDFHPERALGFLPHELDYTHLRMIWRRWKKKAHLSVFGHSLTPFGPEWLDRMVSSLFRLKGDFAVFRLTPDKYHYNHTPVAGRVADIFEIAGGYHSCNPGAVVQVVTPYSKNKRVVTIIDTDVPGGTGVGLVAMIEVVALMIGEIVQCYSAVGYDDPLPVEPGMFLEKGVPKSLYRPGSSTDVLIFQKGRIDFARDLIDNMYTLKAGSRFSRGFGRPLVETDVKVRSLIATARRK